MKNAPASILDLPESGFLVDPKALRPAKLSKTIALVASEVEQWIAEADRFMGRSQYRPLFVTLTYARNSKGNPKDVSRFLNRLQMWMRRQGYPPVFYEWVAELQERGALHYHVMLWVPSRVYLPHFDAVGWWPHGSTQVARARRPVGYLCKYASKFTSSVKRFRKGTRLYGFGGLPFETRERVRRKRMARWARKATEAVRDTEFEDALEREIAQQEHEEAAMLHAWRPDEHPDPGAFETEQEADERRIVEWEHEDTLRGLARRGGSRFARCVGGFVDRLTGVLLPTPWAACFERGVLWVWPKEVMA